MDSFRLTKGGREELSGTAEELVKLVTTSLCDFRDKNIV